MSQAFAIGVTGHRLAKLNPGGLTQIRAALRQAFERAAARLEPRHMECVTSIAEGADTMAAEEALDLGWRLITPLPFPAEDYVRDFPQGVRRRTFMRLLAQADEAPICTGGRQTLADEAEGYRAASHAMLDRVQALIAVWNGENTELIGGTFDTLIEGLRRGLPVLWIPASGAGFPIALGRHHVAALEANATLVDAAGEAEFLAALL